MPGSIQLEGKTLALHPRRGLTVATLAIIRDGAEKGQGQVDMFRGQTAAYALGDPISYAAPDRLRDFRFWP